MSATSYAKSTAKQARRERERRAPPADDPGYVAEATALARRATDVACAHCGCEVPSNELEFSEVGQVCEICADLLAPDVEALALRGAAWASVWVPLPGFVVSLILAIGIATASNPIPSPKTGVVLMMVLCILSLSGLYGTGAGVRGWSWARRVAEIDGVPASRAQLAAHGVAVALGAGTLIATGIVLLLPLLAML